MSITDWKAIKDLRFKLAHGKESNAEDYYYNRCGRALSLVNKWFNGGDYILSETAKRFLLENSLLLQKKELTLSDLKELHSKLMEIVTEDQLRKVKINYITNKVEG